MPAHKQLQGIILDFDGLIFDTETPELYAWSEIFQKIGLIFPEAEYLELVGQAIDDTAPLKIISRLTQEPIDLQEILQQKRNIVIKTLGSQNILPGVKKLLNQAKFYNLKIGLASNSDAHWILNHLDNLKLKDYFCCIKTSDDVIFAKPDPSLYLEVLNCLNLRADQVIAFEDSMNGVLAAKRACIFTLAVPNRVTRNMDLSAADLICQSLEDFDLSEYLH